MADLAVLRTAKTAMDEGLITQAEFDEIKTAFTKAQMIKAGMDAGFVREEDYMQARDSFLQSLDFKVHGPQAVAMAPPAQQPIQQQRGPSPTAAPVAKPEAAYHRPAPLVRNISTTGMVAAANAALGQSQAAPTPRSAAPTPPPLAPQASTSGGSTLQSPFPSADHSALPVGDLPLGCVPIPWDLPKLGRIEVMDGKKSLSGIGLNEFCVNVFNHIKTKSAFKWVSYKIDDSGTTVTVDFLGDKESSYDHFLATLPPDQCRFGVFDYAFVHGGGSVQATATGAVSQKLIFIHWAPETANMRSKMMYASTKEFFKGYLQGISAELQADSLAELQESEVSARIAAAMTKK